LLNNFKVTAGWEWAKLCISKLTENRQVITVLSTKSLPTPRKQTISLVQVDTFVSVRSDCA